LAGKEEKAIRQHHRQQVRARPPITQQPNNPESTEPKQHASVDDSIERSGRDEQNISGDTKDDASSSPKDNNSASSDVSMYLSEMFAQLSENLPAEFVKVTQKYIADTNAILGQDLSVMIDEIFAESVSVIAVACVDELTEEVRAENELLLYELDVAHKQQAFDAAAEGLALTEKEMFKALTDDFMKASDLPEYQKKLELVRRKAFPPRRKISQLETEFDASGQEVKETAPHMRQYTQTMDYLNK
jgi:hypothetical protein